MHLIDTYQLSNDLNNKEPEKIKQILSQFLDETSDQNMQSYNTFDDADNFSYIWTIVKKNNLGSLAVAFIKKIMVIKKEEPQRNKFMMGFANNSENTYYNLFFLESYDKSLVKKILDIYTTPEKKQLFEVHHKNFGKLLND